MVSRASAVGCHPLPGGPLPVEEGVDAEVRWLPRGYVSRELGQRQQSNPQPVQPLAITRRSYRPPILSDCPPDQRAEVGLVASFEPSAFRVAQATAFEKRLQSRGLSFVPRSE
jgi:hypothetical protein